MDNNQEADKMLEESKDAINADNAQESLSQTNETNVDGSFKFNKERFDAEIKRYTFYNTYITSFLLKPITVLFARFLAKRNIKPNLVTMLMLLSVLAAAALFLIPNVVTLGIGIVVLLFFEIADDADGMVARANKRLSRHGMQLDYMMHLLCHPLMIIIFSIVVNRLNLPENIFGLEISVLHILVAITALFAILEVIERHLLLSAEYTKIKHSKGLAAGNVSVSKIKKLIRYLLMQMHFPVFMLIFPIFMLVDSLTNAHISFYVFIFYAMAKILYILLNYCRRLVVYYRKEK